MGVLIAILFGVAILLLILSFGKTKKAKTHIEQQLEQVTLSVGKEVNDMQDRIRAIELDAAITAQQSGALEVDSPERKVLRDMIDMNKRGYSYESISARMKEFTPEEVEQILAPYEGKRQDERGMVAQ
ncbi:hypothetical protein [Metabacillus iocasae]|uniref:DUF2802 domain-containing protein n=1 Tax=Priestia iocasae TaxID=2291674 RepID=A0ABS2QSC9_9BACI|nr:hypothetical protein [Metabacillus iocasae]MBM7702332.1 hypothetical protein [Metabacillus iocasae]